jgi:hypothetical protein
MSVTTINSLDLVATVTEDAPVRVKRAYTVTSDRPKNKPNTSTLVLRQISNANRITGTTTAVYDGQQVDADAESFVYEGSNLEDYVLEASDGTEDRWIVACHDHEFSTTLHTLLEARRIAFLPNLWCAECEEIAPFEVVEDTGQNVYALQH